MSRPHDTPKREFAEPFQRDLACPVPASKIFRFRRRANHLYKLAPSCPERGALAIVTNVGTGCGGRGSVGRELELQGGSIREQLPSRRRTMLKRTAKACGPGARCWRQVGGGFSNPTGLRSIANSPMTVTRRIRRRGEYAISRKAIAQGRSDVSADTCMLVCAFLCISCTRDRGCQPAPGLPCALFLQRAEVPSKGSGDQRREVAKLRLLSMSSPGLPQLFEN
jgi:hypothetical protein